MRVRNNSKCSSKILVVGSLMVCFQVQLTSAILPPFAIAAVEAMWGKLTIFMCKGDFFSGLDTTLDTDAVFYLYKNPLSKAPSGLDPEGQSVFKLLGQNQAELA